jgi:hypothetical protein
MTYSFNKCTISQILIFAGPVFVCDFAGITVQVPFVTNGRQHGVPKAKGAPQSKRKNGERKAYDTIFAGEEGADDVSFEEVRSTMENLGYEPCWGIWQPTSAE